MKFNKNANKIIERVQKFITQLNVDEAFTMYSLSFYDDEICKTMNMDLISVKCIADEDIIDKNRIFIKNHNSDEILIDTEFYENIIEEQMMQLLCMHFDCLFIGYNENINKTFEVYIENAYFDSDID